MLQQLYTNPEGNAALPNTKELLFPPSQQADVYKSNSNIQDANAIKTLLATSSHIDTMPGLGIQSEKNRDTDVERCYVFGPGPGI